MRERQSIHLRRCHVCNHTTQRLGQTVERCELCLKALPESYFYEEEEIPVFSDNLMRPPEPNGHITYRPVRGLSARWLPES